MKFYPHWSTDQHNTKSEELYNTASRYLTHYFKLVRPDFDSDNLAEIGDIAPLIVEATLHKLAALMMEDPETLPDSLAAILKTQSNLKATLEQIFNSIGLLSGTVDRVIKAEREHTDRQVEDLRLQIRHLVQDLAALERKVDGLERKDQHGY